MARLDGFCIDRFEAHLAELRLDGTLIAHSPFERPRTGVRYLALSESGATPQGYVNGVESADACEAAGKRLCTLKEWYGACSQGGQRVYPYGVRYQPGKCNSGKTHVLTRLFGADATRWRYEEHFNSPELNREPGFLARTAEYAGCTTESGIHDLVGNLHEWVSDRIDANVAIVLPLLPVIEESLRRNTGHGIFMGGFYSTTNQHGEGCRFLTPAHEITYHDYSTGFRCCSDAETHNAE